LELYTKRYDFQLFAHALKAQFITLHFSIKHIMFYIFLHSTLHVDHSKIGINIFGATKLYLCNLQNQYKSAIKRKEQNRKRLTGLNPNS
jgi:hypothetical protein